MNSQRRLQVLTAAEQLLYYQQPRFSEEERYHFFVLNSKEQHLIKNIPPSSAVYTCLQLGYFKARHQFFVVTHREAQEDIQFIQHYYFPEKKLPRKFPSRNVQSAIKRKIARFLGYEVNKQVITHQLIQRAQRSARQHNDPAVLFKELYCHLQQLKMVLPGYTTLQDIISQAVTEEQHRLFRIMEQKLPQAIKAQIENLVQTKEEIYKITDLKKDLTSFDYRDMKKEISMHQSHRPLYDCAKHLLPTLEISQQNIHYYAACINYYPAYELGRMKKPQYYLYLLCYLYYRHQKMGDNLVQAFVYHVDRFKKEAIIYAKDILAQQQNVLGSDQKTMGILIGYYADDTLMQTIFHDVAQKAYQNIPKENIRQLSQQMINRESYQKTLEWQYYYEQRKAIGLNLRQIFKALEFQGDKIDHPLLEAADFLKAVFNKKQPIAQVHPDHFPRRVITPNFKPFITDENGKVKPHQYEFFVYYRLRDYVSNNMLYLNDTLQFKSLAEDMKISSAIGKDREQLIKEQEKPKLLMPIQQHLQEIEEGIEDLYTEVNQNITNGNNTDVTIQRVDGETMWRLKYPAPETEFNHKFYEQLPIVSISDIYDFVNEQCHFVDAFKHFRNKNVKGEKDYQSIKAGVVAEATRQGIHLMAARSNLDYETLRNNRSNYIRLDTIKGACKFIISKMVKLSIFKNYKVQDKHYSGIDGSKKGTAKNIAKSRHSPKYFGLEKGLSVMSMVLDNIPVSSDIIGCNDYEGNNLYDIYFGNDAVLSPDVISTDSHGSNQINFCLFDKVDILFAPCYKNIFERAQHLHCFKPLEHYKDMLIKPSNKAKTHLIEKHWDTLVDIFLAIFTKETKQSVLIKKLCSRGDNNEIKKALWEYNNLFFTRYVLNYINDPLLRKAVRITLNRTESYNKLYNAVAKIGGKKFRGATEIEIAIENQATRLITLIIIFYNMYILSELMEAKIQEGDHKAAAIIANISSMAMQHINLSGIYQYGTGKGIDIGEMVKALSNAVDGFLRKK